MMQSRSSAAAGATVSPGRKRKASEYENERVRELMKKVNPKTGMGMMGMPCMDDELETEDPCASTSDSPNTSLDGTIASLPRIRVGNRILTMHKELVEMRDSTDLFQRADFQSLRRRLDEDGFLLVRGVMSRETVGRAREKMLRHLHSKGACRENTEWKDAIIEYQSVWDEKNKSTLSKMKSPRKSPTKSSASASPVKKPQKMIPGWTVDAESGGIIGGREPDSAVAGWREVGNSKELTDVYDGAELHAFYQKLFAQDVSPSTSASSHRRTLPPYTSLPSCTWLRAKGPGEVTAEHADYYYFAKNTNIFGDFWQAKRDEDEKKQTEEERQTCQICRKNDDADSTLLCDLCDRGFHLRCLDPPLTSLPPDEQEWHCARCCNQPMSYWTCWVPLGDIEGYEGRLALIPGSHTLAGYDKPVREDLLPGDFSRSFETSSVWQTPTRLGQGDVILFNIKTIHAATRNGGEKFRLSLDTRVTTSKGRKYEERHGLAAVAEDDSEWDTDADSHHSSEHETVIEQQHTATDESKAASNTMQSPTKKSKR